MTMPQPQSRSLRARPDHAIVRLERNNKELQVLRENMRSYTCEPKTPTLFERCERLKSHLEQMRQKNNELIQAIRDQKQNFDDYLSRLKDQLQEFRQLEQQVLEYIGMARMLS